MNISYNPYKNSDTYNSYEMAEAFTLDIEPEVFPLRYSIIDTVHQKDKEILQKLEKGEYKITKFFGGEKSIDLITQNEKIVVPQMVG